jgi:ArsR family transcriptional regulator
MPASGHDTGYGSLTWCVVPLPQVVSEGCVLNPMAINGEPRGQNAPAKASAPLVNVPDGTIKSLSEIFKLLADCSRLKILLALAGNGEMHVSALCLLLDQSQPAVSHHLALMRMSGLVGYRRDGKYNHYHVDSGVVRDLLEQFFGNSVGGSQLQFEDFSLVFKKR